NIRKTTQQMKLPSEAATRFGRGIHPAMAIRGNIRSANLIQQLGGGTIDTGVVDNYARQPESATVKLTMAEVQRGLGFDVPIEEITRILSTLEFHVARTTHHELQVTGPDHRTDITGPHDLLEEIARIYGYDRIPRTGMDDEMPPQRGNPPLEFEEHVRDLLVDAGLFEAITYSMTTPQLEAKLLPGERPDDRPYVGVANPISSERTHLRHTLLASLLDVARSSVHHHPHLALFELNKIYLGSEEGPLPDEPRRLTIVLSGPRESESWLGGDVKPVDFYDLKGVIETLLAGLNIKAAKFEAAQHPTYYPGRTARLIVGDQAIGLLGQIHPLVREAFDLPDQPVLAAELDIEALSACASAATRTNDVPRFPAVTEDLAMIVDDKVHADKVQAVIESVGGLLKSARLFDVFKGERIGAGKKSLAYRLTYQADRTLTDVEVVKVREDIIKRLREELGAVIRG
ncbi:MAG: phenylalanine--tRNA ligase subunit beta, partial [Thermoflexales bacterium]|nr:phenylalanine--tRNA ligase subunit beta [Thermoflexales bacterium]